MWDKLRWLHQFWQFLCERKTSFNLKRFYYSYAWFCSLRERRTSFCTALISRKTLKKFYDPFLWMGFNCLKATATSRRQFTFYQKVPKNPWYSLYQPWKDERLSWPLSHPVVSKTGPLAWESNTLTTRPLLPKIMCILTCVFD